MTERDARIGERRRAPSSVSVVIPVRNGADVLHRQLDALAAQTYAGTWDVILVDNGSTDATAAVARRWSDRLPGLRVVDASARRGIGYARNEGCAASTADAVLFCDADDQASPEWVAAMVSALADHPIAGGPCELQDPDGTILAAPRQLGLTLGLVPFPIGGCFGVWRDVFDQVGGFEADHPEATAEDAEFCLRAWELGHVAGFAPGALMTKSRRPDARSTWRQWKGYGAGAMFNAVRFRDRGVLPVLVRRDLRLLAWMLAHLPAVRTHEGRMRWVRWVAAKVGWLSGAWRYRHLPVAPRPPVRGQLSHPLRRVQVMEKGQLPRPSVPPLYGVDIETDTAVDGLDPTVGRVLAVAVADGDAIALFDQADETDLLVGLDGHLAGLAPGVIVTWNGARFDLPYLATRAGHHHVELGLSLWPDPTCRDDRESLPGHVGTYRASWHGHRHLDAYRVYRADVGPALRIGCSLKTVARLAGMSPVEVDASRVHDLTPTEMAAYVGSDARCTAALALRRWATAAPSIDPVPVPDRVPAEALR